MITCLFRGKRAVGIEYVPNPLFQEGVEPDAKIVRAKKLVVIGAGTFGSPAILERSGIGAKDILEKAGVEQIVDLPGVGENYQGELLAPFPYDTVLTDVCLQTTPLSSLRTSHPKTPSRWMELAVVTPRRWKVSLRQLVFQLVELTAFKEWSAQWLKDGQGMMAHK